MDARAVTVLRRSEGYLCLRFPPQAQDGRFGALLEVALQALPGTLQTSWVEVEAKLLVRFDPALCSHARLAQRVKGLLEEHAPAAPAAAATASVADHDLPQAPAPGLGEQLGDLRLKLIAATPARFQPMIESATTEKAITNFFNDIVAFYLIRTHWDLIVERWLKAPVKYGNAWMTVFYLGYLLVR